MINTMHIKPSNDRQTEIMTYPNSTSLWMVNGYCEPFLFIQTINKLSRVHIPHYKNKNASTHIELSPDKGVMRMGIVYSDNEVVEHLTVTRELISSAIQHDEISSVLELIGTGFKAVVHVDEYPHVQTVSKEGLPITTVHTLHLHVGQHNPVIITVPADIRVFVQGSTKVFISGRTKESVHNFAAVIRGVKEPNPYTGKGIRYLGETVVCKPGKRK